MYFQFQFQFIYLLTEKQNTAMPSPLSTFLFLILLLLASPTQSNWQQSGGIWQEIKLNELDFSWKGKTETKNNLQFLWQSGQQAE